MLVILFEASNVPPGRVTARAAAPTSEFVILDVNLGQAFDASPPLLRHILLFIPLRFLTALAREVLVVKVAIVVAEVVSAMEGFTGTFTLVVSAIELLLLRLGTM